MFKRTVTFVWRLFNLFKLWKHNVKHGAHVIIHGHLGLSIKGRAEVGDNVYISSGMDMNPLCARDNGFICVEKGAVLSVGDYCLMSSPRIWALQEIVIGKHVMLGGNVTIVDSDCHSLDYEKRRDVRIDSQYKLSKPIRIEDDVFVGMNSMILKGVTLGARCVIGAGSVVTSSIPADCIAAGNPCKVIKKEV